MDQDIKPARSNDPVESATAQAVPPPEVEKDYANPAEKSPRWWLATHAFTLRLGATLGFGLGNFGSTAPTETIWLDSTIGQWKGKEKISVDVWNPAKDAKPVDSKKRRAVINFHGGGFILGQGTDDAWWAGTLMKDFDAVVFSVNYRLAPVYPFPTPVEDCVDAIIQIAKLADKYNLDPSRIILSGFSAGGTVALSSWIILQNPSRWEYQLPQPIPHIAGLALYYPLLDWTLDRPQKRKACKQPDKTLSSGLTDLIDASYLHPPRPRNQRDDIRLSPGLMPDDMLEQLPPVHLCLCEHDMLLAEGRIFAERLQARGKTISLREVENEKHAWDKPLPLAPKESVALEYGKAIEAIKSWFEQDL